MELAKELSLSLTEEQEKERQQSQEIIEARLRASGLTRVAVPRDGNCQFLSIVLSAGIPIDAFRLRSEIVSYLQRLPSMFNFWFDTHFKDFNAYCRHMSRDGSWGDECTLQAAAHLLLRPIRIVTDTVVQDDGDGMPFDREFLPPAIAEELWGAPVTLAYSGYNHYEAAEVPVQAINESGTAESQKPHLSCNWTDFAHRPLTAFYCPLLPFAALHCPLLRFTALCYPVLPLLSLTALSCLLLPFTALCRFLKPFSAVFCLVLHFTACCCPLLPVTALYPFTLPFTALYCLLLAFTIGFYSSFLPFSAFCCPLLPLYCPYCPLLRFIALYCPLLPFTAFYCPVLPFSAVYCPFLSFFCLVLPFTTL